MKLAVFTPLRPARSGIADYSASLLPEIAKHVRVEAFIDDGYEAEPFPPGVDIPIRSHREYQPEEFDETLYQIGNNPFHVYAYDQLLRNPGVVLLHELNLHHLVAAATIRRQDWDAYLQAVDEEGGPADRAYAARVRALDVGPDYEGLALNTRVLKAAKALIVHSDFMARQVRAAQPQARVARIPHGAWVPDVNRQRYRYELGVDETTPLIGVFGFLKPYKRIRESLRALRRLVRVQPRVKMILVGEEHPELPVRRLVADLGLSEHVRVLGYVPLDEFVQYIGACDICLNLRYPTVGETSGTLLRALGLGRAVIVSDVGAFADLPDEICLKVPVDESETDLLFEYLNLLTSRPEAARALGERARAYVAAEWSWEEAGRRFVRALTEPWPSDAAPAAEAPPEPREPREAREEPTAPQSAAPPVAASADAAEAHVAPTVSAGEQRANRIRSWVRDRRTDAAYVETHLTRLVRTLELTPPGGPDDEALEMGAYLHITPILKSELGYGQVRGCALGPTGKVDRREIISADGETFHCEIDNFDAERDPFPYEDGRFATVLCGELLEHLSGDPMHLMSEVNRILRPGGHLVATTPNICSLRAIAAALLTYHPGLFHRYVRPNDEGQADPRHAREYAPRDLQALLEAAGFAVVRLETGPYLERSSFEHEWVRHLLQRYELSTALRDDCLFAVGKKAEPVRERYPEALYARSAE